MSPQDRAEYAKAALDNPTVVEGLKAIKDEIYRKFCETQPADQAAREHYWRLHEAATTFERVLRGYIQAGRMEEFDEPKPTLVGRLRRFGNLT
jgi:hypothetical protein